MNRLERRRNLALSRSDVRTGGRDEIESLLAAVAETVGKSMPGCGVTILVSKHRDDNVDARFATTVENPYEVAALFTATAQKIREKLA